MKPAARRRIVVEPPLDVATSLQMWSAGPGDPTARVNACEILRATWTSDGPATLRIVPDEAHVNAWAWGPGAALLLDRLGFLLGLDDDPSTFEPEHPIVRRLHRVHRGLRVARAPSVFETMVGVIAQQRVTFREALQAYRTLCREFGGAAPGPHGLCLPPSAERLAATPYYRLRPLDRGRAETVRRVARLQASKPLEDRFNGVGVSEFRRRIQTVQGVGPWTAALTGGIALGDADAVPVGDLHLPSAVSWALAGEPRGSDDRMLELLAPFAGHRWRVMRLVMLGSRRLPRLGGVPPLPKPRSF